ncbi:MAG: bacterial transcriptional activator domain-containing protein [Gammaproteobacteria bacterium]|nr:bacterial transcriptional activator domain-containing protein [Gammaproteobacteria bacterium]
MTVQAQYAETMNLASPESLMDLSCYGSILLEVEKNLLSGRSQFALVLLRQAMKSMAESSMHTSKNLNPEYYSRPVKIYTLGRFSVYINGKSLEFNSHKREKPLELLKLLISLGAREINKAHVAELMWPDSCGDTASQALATNLFRLRQLLGKESIELRAGKLTINPAYCWIDIWQFEKFLNNSRKAGEAIDLHSLQQAMDLYQGAFFSNEDFGWLVPRRERLRQKLLTNLKEVATALSNEKRCEEAILIYQKALEVDDLLEELYLGLIRCLVKLERWGEALATYRRCHDAFQAVLGIEPGYELQAIYKLINTKAAA